MLRTVGLAFVLSVISAGISAGAYADQKVPAAEVSKIEETLSTLGCSGYEEIEKEDDGTYEIDDAKCKMGTMDIKLGKDYTVILMSRD